MSGIRVSETKRPPNSPKRPFSSGPVMKELKRSFIAACLPVWALVLGFNMGRTDDFPAKTDRIGPGKVFRNTLGTRFRNRVGRNTCAVGPRAFESPWQIVTGVRDGSAGRCRKSRGAGRFRPPESHVARPRPGMPDDRRGVRYRGSGV